MAPSSVCTGDFCWQLLLKYVSCRTEAELCSRPGPHQLLEECKVRSLFLHEKPGSILFDQGQEVALHVVSDVQAKTVLIKEQTAHYSKTGDLASSTALPQSWPPDHTDKCLAAGSAWSIFCTRCLPTRGLWYIFQGRRRIVFVSAEL